MKRKEMRMSRIIWGFILLMTFSCHDEETTDSSSRGIRADVSFLNAPLTTSGLRVLIFDESKKLVEEQRFTTYPTSLRSSVGKYYFVFVANAMNEGDIPTLQTGVTQMGDVMHHLTLTGDSLNYFSPTEYYHYATPQAVELNSMSSLTVPLKRSVGALDIAFSVPPGATIEEVYANIEQPVTSIDFWGDELQTATSGNVRCRLVKDTDGIYKGQFTAFPQTGATISYDVIYAQGTSQNYPLNQPVNIIASQFTRITTQFSGTLSSTINYSSWSNSYAINYYAGFQVSVTVQGGNPTNYTGLTVKVTNTSVIPNTVTQYDSIPLVNNNGVLSFTLARFIGNGNYVLSYARLHDRDGKLTDPNNRGTSLAVGFNVPGKAAAVTLDGRQNEEEYYVRKALTTMHGTLTPGSAYPGAATYLTRCVPLAVPTQVEGTVVKQWPVSAPGGGVYGISTQVINGEWRVIAFNFENDYNVFASGAKDLRFQGGGGKMPIADFVPMLYFQQALFSKIELNYGNDISGLANIKRLNSLVINNDAVTTANQFSGPLPSNLGTKDMVRFEVSYCQTTSTLPVSYSNWSNISIFHCMGNAGLTGTIPAEYSNYARITLFRLYGCNFSGKLPQSFDNYASMNVGINFNGNKLTCVPTGFMNRYTTNTTVQQGVNIGACTYP